MLTKRLERSLEWFKWVSYCTFTENKSVDSDMVVQQFAYNLVINFPLHKIKGTFLKHPWPLLNVIMCASVEDQKSANERVPLLFKIPAEYHGVSVEPMLGHVWFPVTYPGNKFDIVTCGAETGPGKREFRDEWALSLRDQCKNADVPFFFKKDGHGNGALCGVEYHEWIGD